MRPNFGSYVINDFCTLFRTIYDFPGLQYSTYLWIIKLNFFPRLLCFFLFQVFERRQTLRFCPICFRAGKFDLKRKTLSLNLHKFVFFSITLCWVQICTINNQTSWLSAEKLERNNGKWSKLSLIIHSAVIWKQENQN